MRRIGVVGLGLIGASLLKAFYGKGFELVGVSKSPETVKKAIHSGLVSDASCDFKILEKSELIIIATPIEAVIETVDNILKVNPNATIADVASVKGFIIDYVDSLGGETDFIGLHPMAGSEFQGFDSSVDGLFDGAKWAVVPSKYAKEDSVSEIIELIKSINSIPVITDAKSHDRAVAMISHMPMVLAQALFSSLTEYNELTLKLASSGFRDMTRLACSNTKMAKDMMKYNREFVIEASANLVKIFEDFILNYDNKNLENISQKRQNMYNENGKNVY